MPARSRWAFSRTGTLRPREGEPDPVPRARSRRPSAGSPRPARRAPGEPDCRLGRRPRQCRRGLAAAHRWAGRIVLALGLCGPGAASAVVLGEAGLQELEEKVAAAKANHGRKSEAHVQALSSVLQAHIERGEPRAALERYQGLVELAGGVANLDATSRQVGPWLRQWSEDLAACRRAPPASAGKATGPFRLVPQTAFSGRGWLEKSVVSPRGDRHVLARAGQLWVQDLGSGAIVRRLRGVPGPTRDLAISRDGRRLASLHPTRGSPCLVLWDLAKGERTAAVSTPFGWVTDLRFLPDGSGVVAAISTRQPAAGNAGKSLMAVWSLGPEGPERHFLTRGPPHLNRSPAVGFLPAAPAIGIVTDRGTNWFDPQTGEAWNQFATGDWLRLAGRSGEAFCAFAADPGSSRVAIGTRQGVSVVDPASGSPLISRFASDTGCSQFGSPPRFSPEGRFLLWGDAVWRADSGGKVPAPEGFAGQEFAWTRDGTVIGIDSSGEVARWAPPASEVREWVANPANPVHSGAVRFAPDGDELRLQARGFTWDLSSLRARHSRPTNRAGRPGEAPATASAVLASGGETRVLTGDAQGSVRLWNRTSGLLQKLEGPQRHVSAVAASRSGDVLAAADGPSPIRFYGRASAGSGDPPPKPRLYVWRDGSPSPTHRLEVHKGRIEALAIGPDGRLLASGDSERLRIRSLEGSETGVIWQRKLGSASALGFSPDGERLFVAAPRTASDHGRYRVQMIDWAGDEILAQLEVRQTVKSLDAAPGRPLVALSLADGTVRLWNYRTDRTVVLAQGFVADSNTPLAPPVQWVAFAEDGYFSAGRRGTDFVHARWGQRRVSLDQFGLRFNRPDILLERLGLGTPDMLAHYRAQHQWRAERVGLASDDHEDRLTLPEVRVADHRVDGRRARIVLEAESEGSPLLDHQVYINGIAQLEEGQRALDGQQERLSHDLTLSAGANRIEVAVRNRAGIESVRAELELEGPDPGETDLYYLAVGVSDYRRDELDLGYAHQDALDFADQLDFLQDFGGFDRVRGRVLTDGSATVDGLREAASLLQEADVDDTVVLFVAGHGLHARDRRARFYFLTHEADPADLPATAAPFGLLQDFLRRSPAHRKLLLIDACESGERRPGTGPAAGAELGEGIRDRGAAALSPSSSGRKARPYLYQRGRFIYRDLTRASGAVVFSSSTGGELSYESAEKANGFFTEALLQELPGTASFEGLRRSVRSRVAEWSEGRQHPVVDRDNPQVRIRLH